MTQRNKSVNHPVRHTDLFQTTDYGVESDTYQNEGELPIAMPKGNGSEHNVNEVIQPSITVQSRAFIKAAIKRLKGLD